jgi:uncharacterized protein YdhG (YjbR/CyaY superfamily)
MNSYKNVEEYISSFPESTQQLLSQIREIILKHSPEAEESISYGMPTYKQKGKSLVYFASYKKHIGFYATPAGHTAFAAELANYKQGKGSVQFPINQPMPLDLIGRMVEFKVLNVRL